MLALSYILITTYVWVVESYTNDCVVPDVNVDLQPDYYWRDYRGIIPQDAIKGGQDEIGNTTYIGRIVSSISYGIVPAIIYPGKREAIGTAVGRRISSSAYVQILCSPHRKGFEWKQITIDTIHLLTDYHLIVGGLESNYLVYIGRANNEDEVKVGKVFDSHNEWRGLKLPSKGGSELSLSSFEILTYPRFL